MLAAPVAVSVGRSWGMVVHRFVAYMKCGWAPDRRVVSISILRSAPFSGNGNLPYLLKPRQPRLESIQ